MQIKIKFIRNMETENTTKKEYIFKINKETIEELNLSVGMKGWMENQHAESKPLNKANRYNAIIKDNKALSPFVITDIGYFDDKRRRKLRIVKIGNTLK